MFQLYSYSHLYEDAAAGTHSREYLKNRTIGGKEAASPVLQPGPLPAGVPDVLELPP